ncbi:Rab3 GTPase-activating protein catalytic subunit [Modicella reniformis]|uniref:Rab3 GTPase-activating protein catalytic subunit n=1 Tax=Modicella reniformis TaxID=1440133 RepID=A0A9P6MBY3_9FUNG|nr:Rab3 GTPase-activating protein catalytic subunit [Modicella reniformis]
MDDFDNFEFIDYTTSGPWERFITQIEDSLHSWGLVDKKLGVFDPATIAQTADVADSSPSSLTANIYSNGHDHSTPKRKPQSQQTYQVREMLSLDDATYSLSYHYHPAKARIAEGAERIDPNFLPTTLEGIQYHNLHRWTSLTHLLIISPVTISDIFASTISSSSSTSSVTIDLSGAKLLLSSFAIAFQNTGCSVPVFVPTGQPWDLTFMGLMIQSQSPAPPLRVTDASEENGTLLYMDEEEDDQGIEVRFNTTVVPYPPVQFSSLSGITKFFIEKMGIDDHNQASSPGTHSQSTKEQINATALFCYDLVNWYDEDWRRWKQPSDKEKNGGTGDLDTSLSTDDGLIMNTPDPRMNMEEIKIGGRSLVTLPVPVFPFGPVQDPLRSMRLFARFATAPSNLYLDNKAIADIDASCANIWILQATFKKDDFGTLSGIMEEAIASWSSEAASNGHDDLEPEKDLPYGDVLLSKSARQTRGAITMVDTVDVDNILDVLFEPQPASPPSFISKERAEGCVRLVPASELGLQFKHATTIPYNSFLWRMVQYLLDVISPTSDIPYATSVMGFMKVLWSELLKQFYTRWENSQLIPLIDIYGEGYNGVPATIVNSDPDQEKKPVVIDLRYNLLHQKLVMLNCCIARQILCNKEGPGDIHPLPRRRHEKFNESGPSTTPSSSAQRRSAQLQSLLHGLSDISRPRSADVVPMAKRLFETVKNRGHPPSPPPPPPSQGSSSSSASPSTSSSGILIPQSVSKAEPGSPTSDTSIPKRETSRRRRSSSGRHHDHLTETTMDSEDDDDVFYDPLETSESVVEPIEIQHKNHSLTESFVALKYSSSADSQSGVLVSDLDQTTVITRESDPREVADETKGEGGLRPLKNLKLLRTGAPLMIPNLQEPGYMTEDMIQQQEELFETFGASSDGAKMRAKHQSTQLISDMEAFKAANPGCVLEDFIRWHSPKDWVEDKGEMSARMADAGNYWQELWAHAKRIPVIRQTPLFNHNQEASKALFYLDNISPDQLFLQLLPTMCLVVYDTLVSHPIGLHIPLVSQALKDLGKELVRFPWNELELSGGEDLSLDVIIDRLREAELLMGRAIALVQKFPEQFILVDRILKDQETVVEDGPERECVYGLFSIGESSFPQPTSREFVLETYDPMPGSTASTEMVDWQSRPLQRRMYACFKESEVRIVETIAKDGLYM